MPCSMHASTSSSTGWNHAAPTTPLPPCARRPRTCRRRRSPARAVIWLAGDRWTRCCSTSATHSPTSSCMRPAWPCATAAAPNSTCCWKARVNCINSTTTSRRTPARNDMQDSLHRKLEELVEHHEDLAHALADPDTIADTDKFQRLAQEYAHLEDLVSDYRQYQGLLTDITDLEDLAGADEGDLRDLAAAQLETVQARMAELEAALPKPLVPKDARDNANIYLEFRAGTGGDEAALFAGDLFRMYQQYAEQHRWQVEVLAASEGEHGGYKEIISRLIGKGAYSRLKFESGAHRVQRVPETESQGRVHTSACTVAVMPEAEEIENVASNAADLRVGTCGAAGGGGQPGKKRTS